MRAGVAVAVVLLACAGRDRAGRGSAPAVSSDRLPATGRQLGEVLDETIPLLEGGVVELASLRGKIVVLEISSMSATGGTHTHATLVEWVAGRDEVVLVTIVIDGEVEEARTRWDRSPNTVLGWDPQGALAARLRVGKLPTIIVLDDSGRIAGVWGGVDGDVAREIESTIDGLPK